MQQQYQKNTDIVIDYMTNVGRGKDTMRAYKACFLALGEALEQEKASFSVEFASSWLEKQSDGLGKAAFDCYKAALRKLDEVYRTGEIQHDKFNPEMTRFHCLQECFRQLIDDFIMTNNTLSPGSCKDYRYQMSDILFHFQEMGCLEISDISYDVLFRYCRTLESCTYHVKSQKHSRLNSLLCFLYEKGLSSYGYTVFVTGISARKGYFWNSLHPDVIAAWRAEQETAEHVNPL